VFKVKTFLSLTCASIFLCGCQSNHLYKDNRIAMGTFVEVSSPNQSAAGIVFAEFKRIEGLLSKYDPESEVSQLNRLGELRVSPDTFYVIKKSVEFYKMSAGAFDITVAPLSDIWGFTSKEYHAPSKEEIQAVSGLIGSDKIVLQEGDCVVKFKTHGMKIDLGAIAKGYAVDCSVKKLRESGVKSCLINAGGQVYCLGNNSGRPWRIAVRSPRGKGFSEYLELEDKTISTSGDYEQYFTKDNVRYSHIINPRLFRPASSGVIAVTVIADNGLVADALSTAIFVLGKDKGEELASKFPGTRVQIFGG
jgi:FAD:protein FMN transferase